MSDPVSSPPSDIDIESVHQDLGDLARHVANFPEPDHTTQLLSTELNFPEQFTSLSVDTFKHLEKSIIINQKLQEKILKSLEALAAAKEQNKNKQILLETLLDDDANPLSKGANDSYFDGSFLSKVAVKPLIQTNDPIENKRLLTISNFNFLPYFVDSRGEIPLENIDTQRKLNAPALSKIAQPWSILECTDLKKAVIAENKRLRVVFKERGVNTRKLFGKINVNSSSFEEHNILHLSWENISESLPNRTPRECAIRWTCYDHPCISKNKWSKEEEKQLLELASELEFRNWPLIAAKMPTGRTAIQCFKQYLLNKYSQPSRKRWSKEEDSILLECIKVNGERNWNQISELLENRKGSHILHRWTKALQPNIKRGRWSAEEDQALTAAVMQIGEKNWCKVRPFVTGRTDSQCRERWMNVLRPSLNISEWNPHDDAKLCQLVNQIGLGKWALIAEKLGNRTDNQAWRRWKIIVNIGAVSSDIVSDPRYLVGLKSDGKRDCSYDTELSDSARYPQQVRKKTRKEQRGISIQPEDVSQARRPIGGGPTGRSEDIENSWRRIDNRITTDFDEGSPLPPLVSNIKLYDSVIRGSNFNENLMRNPLHFDDPDTRILQNIFQALFSWPHITSTFSFSPFNDHLPDQNSTNVNSESLAEVSPSQISSSSNISTNDNAIIESQNDNMDKENPR